MAMSPDQLATAIQEHVIDDVQIREMEERLNRADDKFAEERKHKEANPQGFLKHQYTI